MKGRFQSYKTASSMKLVWFHTSMQNCCEVWSRMWTMDECFNCKLLMYVNHGSWFLGEEKEYWRGALVTFKTFGMFFILCNFIECGFNLLMFFIKNLEIWHEGRSNRTILRNNRKILNVWFNVNLKFKEFFQRISKF